MLQHLAMLTYSFISNTEVGTELYKSCARMSTAGRKVLSAPVSVQYRLSLQLTRSALRTVESLCAMTNTVRPFMARSMASCTKCSLSASKALVACALETQRASVEEYALLQQYRQLWGLHNTDSCGGSTVQTAVGAPLYRQLWGLHSTDSCGGSTVQTAVGAPLYRQLWGLHCTDSCGGSTVQTAAGAPQYRQLRGLHSTDSCGGSTVQTAEGAPQYFNPCAFCGSLTSSSSRMVGSIKSALAIATLCFCPPDSLTPLSPTRVS